LQLTIALAAVALAVVVPMIKPRPVHRPGTWLIDGSIYTLWMPDGSVAVVGHDRWNALMIEFAEQWKRYYGDAKLPPGLPYRTPRAAPQQTGSAAAASGQLVARLGGPGR
jgi:hypothetical protein